MATTIAAGEQPKQAEERSAKVRVRSGSPLRLNLGVRARQIAIITLLIALIIVVYSAVNIANLTGVIIGRATEEARQLSAQIDYAVRQELAHNAAVDRVDDYTALVSEHSGIRGLMESTIVSSNNIAYVYLANVSGAIIGDSEGHRELAANRYMIGDARSERPDLYRLANQNGYAQLLRVLLGGPIYEYREHLPIPRKGSIEPEGSFAGELHIGVSATIVRKELLGSVATNLIIGLLALVAAAVVAVSSANLLLRPLQAISTSIDRLGLTDEEPLLTGDDLPRDEMVTGVTARLRQLGERLAGERSELELMRGRLRQVVSHLEERLLLINREGRVILASPDAEQILGINGVDLTGLPIDETLGADHPLVATVERAFSQRRSIARTTLQLPGAPRPRQLLASVQYIEDAGEPVGALVSMRDYESFQKFESQWDLSKKLADLGRITSGIAHEVKNPLNAMVIHLEILRSKLETGKPDHKPQLEILDSEIKRLDRVVQTFLTFTRPVEVHLQPIDLNIIVSQVIALASTEAQERGVKINTQLEPGPLVVKGDSDLLKQTLLNIIINGCQAMPEGGPMKVATSRGDDGSARITVTDRGIGIADEDQARIFNLYYTTKKGGTGIGLAQAFRAVQLHGGEIAFHSQVGVGTAFEIILPAAA
ncbi:MAG TPA: ATP-binding protein [Blastocatellia bacterium]|nr:ATP-binding protein [Blastocatellia bacterium]